MSVGWYFLMAAAGLDLLLPFLLAPFYPGYSHRRQVMSVLGSPESAPPHQTYGLPLETALLS